jgi:predicted aconitase with swiveling domain
MEGAMIMKLRGHTINKGKAEGEAIVYRRPFSFVGDLDPASGIILTPGHKLEGQSLAKKVFVFTTGRGSSVGPYYAYRSKIAGNAPAALICVEAEPVIGLSAITADIPMVDRLDKNPLDVIETGDYVKVDAARGIIEVTKAH